MNFYPTIMELVGHRPETGQQLDGVSMLPLLKNPRAELGRDALYWHYPLQKPHFLGGRSSGAIRQDNWKLIEFFNDGKLELYNLVDDIGEKHDLAEKMPEKAAQMQKRLASWRSNVGVKSAGEA